MQLFPKFYSLMSAKLFLYLLLRLYSRERCLKPGGGKGLRTLLLSFFALMMPI